MYPAFRCAGVSFLDTVGAMSSEALPNRIREFREARGWTVRDLASRAHMDFNSLFRLETGAIKLDVDRMRRLARVFGVKPSALLLDEDVEFRADDASMELLETLNKVASSDRVRILGMCRELLAVLRSMQARSNLTEAESQELARVWGRLDEIRRSRALDFLRLLELPPNEDRASDRTDQDQVAKQEPEMRRHKRRVRERAH